MWQCQTLTESMPKGPGGAVQGSMEHYTGPGALWPQDCGVTSKGALYPGERKCPELGLEGFLGQ